MTRALYIDKYVPVRVWANSLLRFSFKNELKVILQSMNSLGPTDSEQEVVDSITITKKFPVLFKRTNKNAIQSWSIHTERNVIVSQYGQVGGKIQTAQDIISLGKNLGKRNATTIEQQAEAEAKSRWTKQLGKGYVEDQEQARQGQVDTKIVCGGVPPMLAADYTDFKHDVTFPACVQPKMDGNRGIIWIEKVNGQWKTSIWSRTRKRVNCMKHVEDELTTFFQNYQDRLAVQSRLILDGEFYNHLLKHQFEQLVSLFRQDKPLEKCKLLQYHVFDVIEIDGNSKLSFVDRFATLNSIFAQEFIPEHIKVVRTDLVQNESELNQKYEEFVRLGYEGAIVRNSASLYEQDKRSHHLQKMKPFDEAEFKIIGMEEGKGKLLGHAAKFVCVTNEGKEFRAKLDGELSRLKEYFQNPTLWQNKLLTVSYQGMTGKNGVPRFGFGKTLRDYDG